MVHMDGVLHDTTRESVNAIADTNPAFSGCCPAPRAQFLFITGSLNGVSALIFQVYDVLEHLDTGTVCFSCDPIEKNMFNWLRSWCRASKWWTISKKADCLDRLPCCIGSYLIHINHWVVMFLFSVDTVVSEVVLNHYVSFRFNWCALFTIAAMED